MTRLLCLFLVFNLAGAQTLTVFAASSLIESFMALSELFAATYPTANTRLNIAGSAVLATQIEQGAPADVFASADLATLLRVVSEENVRPFASNDLVLIAARDSDIYSLEDLTKPHLLVLAAPTVPIGNYTRLALSRLEARYGDSFSEDVLTQLVSEETNVRQAAAKVELGEADATFVYKTDLPQLEAVRAIELLPGYGVKATYYIAVVPDSRDSELAALFVEFVLSEAGQAVLADHGFGLAIPNSINLTDRTDLTATPEYE